LSLVFGVTPIGLMACALALRAWAAPDGLDVSRVRRHALRWALVSLAVGAALEIPVVAAIATAPR